MGEGEDGRRGSEPVNSLTAVEMGGKDQLNPEELYNYARQWRWGWLIRIPV